MNELSVQKYNQMFLPIITIPNIPVVYKPKVKILSFKSMNFPNIQIYISLLTLKRT